MTKRTVVAAALVDDLSHPTRLFAAHRVGKTVGWELPGGKCEPGEAPTDALVRELREELAVNVDLGDELVSQIGVWPINERLEMRIWWAVADGEPRLLEDHDDLRWVTPDTMLDLGWLEADVAPIMAIRNAMILQNRPRYTRRTAVADGVLRPLERRDVADLHTLWSHADLARNLGHTALNGAQSELYVRGRLAEVARGELIALVLERDDRVIAEGRINLSPSWSATGATGEWNASIGDAVHPDVQGQGIGTSLVAELLRICFDELGVRLVRATVFDRARASARVVEKCGMRISGRNQQCFRDIDGTWRDDDLYVLTRQQWEQHRDRGDYPGVSGATSA